MYRSVSRSLSETGRKLTAGAGAAGRAVKSFGRRIVRSITPRRFLKPSPASKSPASLQRSRTSSGRYITRSPGGTYLIQKEKGVEQSDDVFSAYRPGSRPKLPSPIMIGSYSGGSSRNSDYADYRNVPIYRPLPKNKDPSPLFSSRASSPRSGQSSRTTTVARSPRSGQSSRTTTVTRSPRSGQSSRTATTVALTPRSVRRRGPSPQSKWTDKEISSFMTLIGAKTQYEGAK
jgi:hypothetical protein